jgi:hypothetical protein
VLLKRRADQGVEGVARPRPGKPSWGLTAAGNLGGGSVTGDQEERNRVLGFPVDRQPRARQAGKPEHPPQAGEPQRILGFSGDWLEQFAAGVLRPLLRRIRGTRGHR